MAGKKGKKGKKEKKGKKGKKSKQLELTAKEAILAYQINVAEKKLEDIRYEIRGWEEKNRRHLERNNKLKADQELLLQNLLEKARDFSKMFGSEEIKTRDDVILVMKEKWSQQRKREKGLEDLKSQIARKMVEIEEVQKQVDVWKQYRDIGSHVHETEIRLLEHEMNDLQSSFDEMASHLTTNLKKIQVDIEQYTDESLAQQKDKASDRAMARLDKKDRQEVVDNEWLKKEVEIHRAETAKVRERVEELEYTNLQIMSNLFDCTVEDLKISRTFYLTQFEDSENLEKSGILEMDLACLSPLNDDSVTLDTTGKKRPKSAIQRAIEDKVRTISLQAFKSKTEEEANTSDIIQNISLEEEDFEDYLDLGPVELKLLSVAGTQIELHSQARACSADMTAQYYNPDVWPVTQPMLKRALTPQSQ